MLKPVSKPEFATAILPSTPPRRPLRHGLLIAGIAAYLFLGLGVCLTTAPLPDEGLVANPAFNLATRGVMATTLFADRDTAPATGCATVRDCLSKVKALSGHHEESYVGMRRYTYWIMPVYLLMQAAWYRLIGFGVVQARLLALLWGPLLIGACYYLVTGLFGSRRAAAIAVALLVTDMTVLGAGSFARMDMFCAALGYAALAVYLYLREAQLDRAVLLANALAAIACFAHPNSALAVAGVATIALSLDAGRLRLRHAGLALAPYAAGALAWACYIAQAPAIFLSQFLANASGRGSKLFSPLAAIKSEIFFRYGERFGLGPAAGLSGHAKTLVLALFWTALVVALCTWKSWSRENRVLFRLLAVYAVLLTFGEGMKFSFYLIHIIPLYVCVVAVVADRAMAAATWPRAAAVACLLAITAVNLSWWTSRVRANAYARDFAPAANFLRPHLAGTADAMCAPAVSFGLGFPANCRLDTALLMKPGGPELIAVSAEWWNDFNDTKFLNARLYAERSARLEKEYWPAYSNSRYRVFLRRNPYIPDGTR